MNESVLIQVRLLNINFFGFFVPLHYLINFLL